MAVADNAVALSIVPRVTSRVQSPPARALPVSSLEAPTSAPVQRDSSSTRVRPSLPAPTLQPYSWMSAPSLKDWPHWLSGWENWPMLSALRVVLPRVNSPEAP
ncbi:hypothetical protein D3C76_1056900 [compost metagenome]